MPTRKQLAWSAGWIVGAVTLAIGFSVARPEPANKTQAAEADKLADEFAAKLKTGDLSAVIEHVRPKSPPHMAAQLDQVKATMLKAREGQVFPRHGKPTGEVEL